MLQDVIHRPVKEFPNQEAKRLLRKVQARHLTLRLPVRWAEPCAAGVGASEEYPNNQVYRISLPTFELGLGFQLVG